MNELQERYGKLVKARLQQVLVTKDNVIFNNYYEGNPTAGAVKVPSRSECTVKDYDKANGIKGTATDTTYITLAIDNDKAINEIIDNYDAEAVPDGIIADRLDRASYALANAMDKDSLLVLEKEGTILKNTNACTKATAYESIIDVDAQMTEAGVPVADRYLIVSPKFKALLMKSADFIKASDLGQTIVNTGAIGQIDGFNVYVSGNLAKADTTLVTGKKTDVEFIAGHKDYATRVAEFSIAPRVVSLDGSGNYVGASAVQGRMVYGAKVLEKNAIYVKTAQTANA